MDGRKVRSFTVGSQTEGCVADDTAGIHCSDSGHRFEPFAAVPANYPFAAYARLIRIQFGMLLLEFSEVLFMATPSAIVGHRSLCNSLSGIATNRARFPACRPSS